MASAVVTRNPATRGAACMKNCLRKSSARLNATTPIFSKPETNDNAAVTSSTGCSRGSASRSDENRLIATISNPVSAPRATCNVNAVS